MPAECDYLSTIGLTVVEADIELFKGVLTVDTAAYSPRKPGTPCTLRRDRLLSVSGIRWDAAIDTGNPIKPPFDPPYKTRLSAPDLACPDSQMTGRFLTMSPKRSSVHPIDRPTTVTCAPALYPDLQRLLGPKQTTSAVWSGSVGKWTELYKGERTRFRRRSVFGPPSFQFDEVEIVGFRTALTPGSKLIDRLNFHQRSGDINQRSDFRYEAATTTVIIEMLRYGKMRSLHAEAPFEDDDFMCQHELLARVVVGRVDDDTAQARDPALFVPAILVDNPWSKAVGRQFQGFPKVLAEFRGQAVPGIPAVPLSMDGTLKQTPGGGKIPFHQVTEVHIATGPGDSTAAGSRILSFEYPDQVDGSKDAFIGPELTSIFSSVSSRRSPWEQFDFDEAEFRRAFARSIVGQQFGNFRIVQVSPVNHIDLPGAWILGACTLSDVRVAFPAGIATLRFEWPDSAPKQWIDLCQHLADNSTPMASPPATVRVKCSMQLDFDDGLAW